jgi:hypothetical protein
VDRKKRETPLPPVPSPPTRFYSPCHSPWLETPSLPQSPPETARSFQTAEQEERERGRAPPSKEIFVSQRVNRWGIPLQVATVSICPLVRLPETPPSLAPPEEGVGEEGHESQREARKTELVKRKRNLFPGSWLTYHRSPMGGCPQVSMAFRPGSPVDPLPLPTALPPGWGGGATWRGADQQKSPGPHSAHASGSRILTGFPFGTSWTATPAFPAGVSGG